MRLTIKAKSNLLFCMAKEYVDTVNKLVEKIVVVNTKLKLTSKDVKANLPGRLKNQCLRDAYSVFSKAKALGKTPILKKPVCVWNNQSYSVKDMNLSVPIFVNGKSKRMDLSFLLPYDQTALLQHKLGSLRISIINGKWIAQIAVEVPEQQQDSDVIMGIDLGLKVPAVAVTSSGKTRFFGNGRKNKFVGRKFKHFRKKLGELKKPEAIKRLNQKEQRWMQDQDHKVSRQIINFALQNRVSVIRMEQLSGIRQTARTSRKNEHNLHTWSFRRLQQYIEYKAKLTGIRVEYVKPEYTSQRCPTCGKLNHAKDRLYQCSCGIRMHRDRVGATNIIAAPIAA